MLSAIDERAFGSCDDDQREALGHALAYQGRYLLGSPVEPRGGSLAGEVAQPERPDGKERPVVARWLGDATLGEPIDPGADSSLAIMRTPPPLGAGVDLGALRAAVPANAPFPSAS